MIEQENGTYRWTGTVDAAFDKKVYKIVFGVMGGMCVFFLVMALIVSPEMLLVTLLSDLGVMAVVSLITIPYMIGAAWDNTDSVFEVVTAYYRKLCDYMSFQDQGIIEGRGCGTVSMTKGSQYMKAAYQLGRSLH